MTKEPGQTIVGLMEDNRKRSDIISEVRQRLTEKDEEIINLNTASKNLIIKLNQSQEEIAKLRGLVKDARYLLRGDPPWRMDRDQWLEKAKGVA